MPVFKTIQQVRTDPFYSDDTALVNILVGSDEASFRVPIKTIRKVSPVLRALLRKTGTKEAEIHLPDKEPHIFDLWVEWLFAWAVTLAGENSKFEDDDVTTDRAVVTAGQGNSKTNAGGNSDSEKEKGDDDDFLDEQTIEFIKLHFLADRYSVNALQRHVEKRLAKLWFNKEQ